VSQAARLPEVVDVLTFEIRTSPASSRQMPAGPMCGHPFLRTHDVATLRDRRVLGSHARWVGMRLVRRRRGERGDCEAALRLIKVDWNSCRSFLTPLTQCAGAPILIRSSGHQRSARRHGWRSRCLCGQSDVAQALADADVVLTATTTYHNATQNSLDNWSCLIEWNEDNFTVWSNSYEAHQTRMHLSEMLTCRW